MTSARETLETRVFTQNCKKKKKMNIIHNFDFYDIARRVFAKCKFFFN